MKIKTVSDNDIESVKSNHMKVKTLHYGEIYEDELEGLTIHEKADIMNWKPESNGEIFHIEAAFESIHYVLTSESEWNSGTFPLNFLQYRKLSIGEIGWGPVSFFYSKEVKEIYEGLKAINKEDKLKTYSSVDFNAKRIGPRGYVWQNDDGEKIIEKISALINFIEKAVHVKSGIYLTIE